MVLNDTDDKLLLSKANDTLRISENRYSVKTLGFLNPAQRGFLKKNLIVPADMKVEFDGGFDDAERTLMVCRPDFLEPDREEYICVLECTGKFTGELSHRDYLGSLMGLGITRESIGDILVFGERTLFFAKPESAEYILQNLTKIGRCGVNIQRCSVRETVVPKRKTKDIQGTVAGLRLDCVLAMAARLSRAKAAELIRAGLVTVNWVAAEETDLILKEGDIISVRGIGRMRLAEIGSLSGKGRYHLTVSQYV